MRVYSKDLLRGKLVVSILAKPVIFKPIVLQQWEEKRKILS